MKKIITLLFILISSLSFSQEKTNCPDIKTGFYGYPGELRSVVIYRTKKAQIEYDLNSDKWTILKLDWISNCDYRITFYKSTRKAAQAHLGQTFTVVITSHNTKGYKCKVTPLNSEAPPMKGEILYKTKVAKKTQKKLKKLLRKNT